MGAWSKIGSFFGSASSGSIGVIGSVIKSVAAPFTAYQVRKSDEADAQHKMNMAKFEFNTGLILSTKSHNAQWELESLKIKKRSPMQWISFLVLGAPFIIAWFNPALVAAYFVVSIKVIPTWYVQLFVSIIGVVWGIAQLKNVAGSVKTTIMERKQMVQNGLVEIEKIKAMAKEKPVDVIKDKLEELLDDDQLNVLYPELKHDK